MVELNEMQDRIIEAYGEFEDIEDHFRSLAFNATKFLFFLEQIIDMDIDENIDRRTKEAKQQLCEYVRLEIGLNQAEVKLLETFTAIFRNRFGDTKPKRKRTREFSLFL